MRLKTIFPPQGMGRESSFLPASEAGTGSQRSLEAFAPAENASDSAAPRRMAGLLTAPRFTELTADLLASC